MKAGTMLTPVASTSATLGYAPATARRRKLAGTRGGIGCASRRLYSLCLRLAIVLCVFCCWARVVAANTILVATPSTVAAGEEFAVEWTYFTDDDEVDGTTGDLHPFEIELRSCGTDGVDCEDGSCGSSTVSSLCQQDGVCMDSDGSYDVVIPSDTGEGDYVILVSYVGPSTSLTDVSGVSACTESFAVTAPDVPVGDPFIAAMTPQDLSLGEAFTAQWDYDDGEGQAAGTFDVDLYSCADGACADASCGVFTTALCGVDGCFDPGPGDYDVRIPDDISPGSFKLQVKKSNSDDASACTVAAFNITEEPQQEPTPTPTLTLTQEPSTPALTSAPIAAPIATTPAPSPVLGRLPTSAPVTPGVSPTGVPARIECNPDAVLTYSYTQESSELSLLTIEHASGDREENGCASLTTVWEWLQTNSANVPQDLLEPVYSDTYEAETTANSLITGTWLLRTSIDVSNGVMLEIKGTDVDDGDCDELRISSSTDAFFRIRGYGGHLYIYKSKIVGWSEDLESVHDLGADSEGDDPRSYISCVSESIEDDQTCDGRAQKEKGECRMDIIESEIKYLGYDSTESYGVTWKVRGLCSDLSNVDTIFERVRVYGDLKNSTLDHLWYGHYSYGHLGGVWTNNILHDNHVYGFDPHDDSDFLTIEGNTCYNNGNHGIIASKRCDHLSIKDNHSYNNGGSGIMLHRSCDDSIISGNLLTNNADAGLSIVETSRTIVVDNTFSMNEWGVRLLVGATDNLIQSNVMDSNRENDIFIYLGPDAPLVEPLTGINVGNVFKENTINVTAIITVDVEDSSETSFTNNIFEGNAGILSFVRSDLTEVVDNTGPATEVDATVEDSCFTDDSDISPEC